MGNCSCGGIRFIFSCSGCADVGEAADRAVRIISKSGKAKMSCLAGIGAGLNGFIKAAQMACGNVVVDGCTVACAKTTLEKNGIAARSFILTDMGYLKGEMPPVQEVIDMIVAKITRDMDTGG